MKKIIKKMNRLTVILLLLCILSSFVFPSSAFAAIMTIRQELNITDSYLGSASGAYATSSEMVNIDSSKYSSGTYYFEVVASTTSATNATISLVNATSSVSVASVTINGTSYSRYRSAAFTAPGVATDYVVKVGNESVGKGIIASRVIVLQSANPLPNTETQIEIGNYQTYNNSATSTFTYPKYWYYDSSKWDGSPTFYAEVTFNFSNLLQYLQYRLRITANNGDGANFQISELQMFQTLSGSGGGSSQGGGSLGGGGGAPAP